MGGIYSGGGFRAEPVGRGLAAVVFRPGYAALSWATGLGDRKLDELLQSRVRGPSREGLSDGPSGQRPRGHRPRRCLPGAVLAR